MTAFGEILFLCVVCQLIDDMKRRRSNRAHKTVCYRDNRKYNKTVSAPPSKKAKVAPITDTTNSIKSKLRSNVDYVCNMDIGCKYDGYKITHGRQPKKTNIHWKLKKQQRDQEKFDANKQYLTHLDDYLDDQYVDKQVKHTYLAKLYYVLMNNGYLNDKGTAYKIMTETFGYTTNTIRKYITEFEDQCMFSESEIGQWDKHQSPLNVPTVKEDFLREARH